LRSIFEPAAARNSYLGDEGDDRGLVASIPIKELAGQGEDCMPAFAEAVEAHKAMVYSIAWNFLRDRASAEELAQDVFLLLHKNWGTLQTRAHLVFWLRKVTAHRAIDFARKRNLRAETTLDETGEPTVLERLHDSFLTSYLGRMVASLPEKQRMAIVLRYQEDLEIDEIARVLGMKVNTVKTHLNRGLDMLRAKTAQRLRKGLDSVV
jgi:RNA polymerase sigma-70 factor (ECF subfamily)